MLAAFALPTLERSASAAIDWFSVFFFTIAAATGWAFYVAMQTGEPAKLAANVAKLSPGFQNTFSPIALAFAVAATLAWAWLVKWRTGRNRHPIWKSMVLPAGGVTLSLVLVMTVLLPPFDNARSYRSMVQRVARQISHAQLHLDAGHVAGADRRARVPGRLAGRRGHAAGQVEVRDPDAAAPAASRRMRRGCSSRANGGSAARTTSSTSTSAPPRPR